MPIPSLSDDVVLTGSGYPIPSLSADVVMDAGESVPVAAATLGLGFDSSAIGWRTIDAATALGLGIDESAAGWIQPAAAATLELGADVVAEGFSEEILPAEGFAALGLGLDGIAVGERASEAAAVLGLGATAAALGIVQPVSAATLGMNFESGAIGGRLSEGSTALGLTVDASATGWIQPSVAAGLMLSVGDDPPRNWPARELSGYHRPLSGEAANLTLTLDIPWRDRAAWANPPLGAAAVVRFGVEPLLEGTLTAVSWSRAELNVSVEG